jgi:hypothetical protein
MVVMANGCGAEVASGRAFHYRCRDEDFSWFSQRVTGELA